MSLGPTCLLLGLVWDSCLQGGSPQGQVPISPGDGCASWAVVQREGEPGRMGRETPGWGLVSSPLKGSRCLRTETDHSQASRGSASPAGLGQGP